MHNKSLVVGTMINENERATNYINDIVSKITVSNNIIVVSNDNEAHKIKNSINSSNSSIISTNKGNLN